MARGRCVVSVALLALACTESPVLFVPYPEVGSSPSMVFAFEGETDPQLIAVELEFGLPILKPGLVVEGDEPLTLHALLLGEPLQDLGLSAGPLAPARSDDLYAIELVANTILSYDSARQELGHWTEPSSVPPRYQPLRVHDADPFRFCPKIELEQIDLPDARSEIRALLPVGLTQVFVSTWQPLDPEQGLLEEEKLFLIDLEGDALSAREIERPEQVHAQSAAFDATGELWMAGVGGVVTIGHFEGDQLVAELVANPNFPDFDPVWFNIAERWVVLMSQSGEVRGATRTSTSGLVWHDGPLHHFESVMGLSSGSGALLTRGANELWAGAGSRLEIARIRHDGTRFLPVELDTGLEGEAAIGVSALVDVPLLGTLAGMTGGAIRRYDEAEGRWVSLGDTAFAHPIHNIALTPNGFMFVGGTGLFSFYVVSEGYCPIDARGYMGLRTIGAGRRVLSFGDGVLVGGGTALGRQQALSWIQRR